MTQLPIDLDSETVQLDGQWYSRDDLARRIKGMLDSGDYAVGRPSAALEQLNGALASLRTLAFRALPSLCDALNAAAAREGKTVGSLIREALESYLASTGESSHPEPPALAPSGPMMPVIAGPGALKAAQLPPAGTNPAAIVTEEVSPEDAAQAVSLTPKKKEGEEQVVERRWFGG